MFKKLFGGGGNGGKGDGDKEKKPKEALSQQQQTENEFKMISQMMQGQGKLQKMKFEQFLKQISSPDQVMVLNGVMELSTELSMTQEAKPGGFKLETLMPSLVQCLKT